MTVIALAMLFGCLSGGASAAESAIKWQAWTDDVFVRAKAENRLVLLNLEAVWCHWCHVMEERTYHDPKVVEWIEKRFIPVRVDQDSRPDIAQRYERWGWPATVLFAPDGTELSKLRGYYGPDVVALVLEAAANDPTPGEAERVIPERPLTYARQLPAERRAFLDKFFRDAYDAANAGWGNGQKFIEAEALAYALAGAKEGDAELARMARATIDKSFNLIDPVWGGAYQYSDEPNWLSPHFEKLMAIQAAYLRAYATAYSLWGDDRYRRAADEVYRYLRDFLRAPNGGFYTSQDADLSAGVDGHEYYALKDAERRRLGLPPIDMHQYARENGWAIGALAAYYDATGETAARGMAIGAADWVLANRALPGGGLRHGADDPAGPYLGDSLAMAQAFVDLYRSTADRRWLGHARATAEFIAATFIDADSGGFLAAAAADPGPLGKPVKAVDENVAAVRLFNLLNYYTGEARYRRIAEAGMGYLASPPVVEAFYYLPGVLQVDRELTQEPARVTVVGRKDDPRAQALYAAALAYPAPYKRAEWWDRREGKLLNPDVDYPSYPHAAAFACTSNFCSLPVTDPAAVAGALDRLDRKIR